MNKENIDNSKTQILQAVEELANYAGLRIQAAMTVRHSFSSADDKPMFELAYQQADTKMKKSYEKIAALLDKFVSDLTKVEEEDAPEEESKNN